MIRTVVLLVAFLASVAAFKPMQMTMGIENFQKNMAKALGVGAVAIALGSPVPAMADGASSKSTVYRARNNYGAKIFNYGKDVDSSNFAALSDKSVSNAFDLFISGTNRGFNAATKDVKAKETELASTIKTAIAAKDAGKLKSAYSEFIAVADLKPDYKPGELGQTDSAGNGYAPTWGTDRQYIYQR